MDQMSTKCLNDCLLVLREAEAEFTRMGVYHFRAWGGFLFCDFLGLGSYGSYSCSGIFTTAFFGFSSLAPSSVEPFPPQRTYTRQKWAHIKTEAVDELSELISASLFGVYI